MTFLVRCRIRIVCGKDNRAMAQKGTDMENQEVEKLEVESPEVEKPEVSSNPPRQTMKAFLISRLRSGGQHTVKDLTAAVIDAGLTRVKADDEAVQEKKVRASVSVTLTLMQTRDHLPVTKPARGVYAWETKTGQEEGWSEE